MERTAGFEPAMHKAPAWKAGGVPLSNARFNITHNYRVKSGSATRNRTEVGRLSVACFTTKL